MTNLKDKVAVVTGGASGIGRAMAERFAEEGMKIVIADVEEAALNRAQAEMKADGAEVLAVRCDVSKAHDVKALADQTLAAYDSVHILCNNAGVGFTGPTWAIPLEDWEWVLGVNLWGVIHGIHYFVPIMLKHGEPSWIVNTASMAGLTSGAGMAPYYVSKHSVVTMSEGLHYEFQQLGSKIRVSVLCPGWVDTKINESDRNRPGGAIGAEQLHPMGQAFREVVGKALKEGLKPREVAELVFQSIQDNTFYILPHAHWKDRIEMRMQDILLQRDPTVAPPPLA